MWAFWIVFCTYLSLFFDILAVVIEWETDNLTIVESSPTTPLCASITNPQIEITEVVQLAVSSMNLTANGITHLVLLYREWQYFHLCIPDNEDYYPILGDLSFMVITGNRQCINISLADDTVLENDEVFHIVATSTNLITLTQSIVQVIILNDDCK